MYNNETVGWLVSCPSGDGNFKSRLKDATIEDLKEALLRVNALPKLQRSKVAILERKLRKKEEEE